MQGLPNLAEGWKDSITNGLATLGLPIEALTIIAAVDQINDMFCTSTNVVGDIAVNTIVDRHEKPLDKGIESY